MSATFTSASFGPAAAALDAAAKPAVRQRVLRACLLASALGHAALLGSWQVGAGSAANGLGAGVGGQAAALPGQLPAVIVRMLETENPADTVQAPAARPGPAPVERDAASPEADPGVAAPARSATATARDGVQQGDDLYLPRSQLDRAPQAWSTIDLPYPDGAPLGRFRAVVTLFIDANGQVRRVRAEGEPLPPALEDSARQAFLAARFEPGAKDGHAVRSRIRVEVEFSAEALPGPATTAAAAAADAQQP